ncbi:hypothetical protein HYALB_00005107 [Hymenoscyphus albidus]|uniref:Transcription factor CBF/NF-Y/archaeal histone domain-containing protein n=1 Tax=Hymenoscyphus albidus TaxID=595503 RepID=A0A9N9LZK0_9HELO|nr:hypothetical protein HYALB_00005107 [Hymenoscyphus albidus]
MPSPDRPQSSHKFSSHDDAQIHNFAVIARIMKDALPNNAKITKDAKECMQACVSEFISFITSEAAESCLNSGRKAITGEEI